MNKSSFMVKLCCGNKLDYEFAFGARYFFVEDE